MEANETLTSKVHGILVVAEIRRLNCGKSHAAPRPHEKRPTIEHICRGIKLAMMLASS